MINANNSHRPPVRRGASTTQTIDDPTGREALVYLQLAVAHLNSAASKIATNRYALASSSVRDEVNGAFDMIVDLQDLIDGES